MEAPHANPSAEDVATIALWGLGGVGFRVSGFFRVLLQDLQSPQGASPHRDPISRTPLSEGKDTGSENTRTTSASENF